jgi:tRNA pseudouridine13 synthase
VLADGRGERKLRRGELAGNRFEIRLRELSGADWHDRLGRVFESGAPNYFGPQRFGGDNLERALAWLPVRRRRTISPFKRGLYLSVLRSLLFNAILARRVQDRTWRTLLPGDVDLDGMPTAPLWGRGRSATGGAALEAESAALAPYADVLDGLEHAGVEQARRSLVLVPRNAWVAEEEDTVRLGFELPPGAYATSLLREAFDLGEGADADAEVAS